MTHDPVNIKAESTWLEPGVKTKQQLIDWILIGLGYPLLTVELSQEQLDWVIQNALEKYSKYAYFVDKYLAVNLSGYERGRGINLKEYRITSVKEVSLPRDKAFGMEGDLFWSPYSFMAQSGGGYPFFNGNNGTNSSFMGSWITWHMVHEYFDVAKRLTGSNPDFRYDRSSGYFQLFPEPRADKNQYILLTCQCLPPLEELYGNEYVKRLCSAYAKILLGTIRSKFQGVTLPGGGTLDSSIGDKGQAELDQILENIIKDESKGQCCYIV